MSIQDTMRICIAGAIGGTLAVRLSAAGHQVSLLAGWFRSAQRYPRCARGSALRYPYPHNADLGRDDEEGGIRA